jgi:hypothetical protein
MGLSEKRMAASLRDERIPYYQGYLDSDLGFTIKLEVDLSSMENDLTAMQYVYNQGLDNLYYMLKYIGYDQIGKDALKEQIQTARLVNIPVGEKKHFELKDGILTVFEPYADVNANHKYSYSELQKLVEELL